MNFLFLHHFHAVARHGGFTRASRALNVSQPTLSRSVRLLEQDCGKTLFTRGKAGVALTEEGKALYQQSQTVFDALDLVEGTFFRRDQKATLLRVAASENISIHLLPGITEKLSKKYDLNWDIFSGTAEVIQRRLVDQEADIGISYHPAKGADLRSEEIAAVKFVAIAATKTAAKISRRKHLDALIYVGSRAQEYRSAYLVVDRLNSLGIKPRQILQSNSQEFQIRRAMCEGAFTVVPEFAAREYLHRRMVSIIPSIAFTAKLYAARRKGSSPGDGPIFGDFVGLIRELAQ